MSARCIDLLSNRRYGIGVDVEEGNIGAFLPEADRRSATNAPRGTGDDGCSSRELHAVPPWCAPSTALHVACAANVNATVPSATDPTRATVGSPRLSRAT